MFKHLSCALLILVISMSVGKAQEKYGKTLNLGLGATYYGYVGRSGPAITLNYEFDVAKNFTLAPTIGFITYRHYHYWGGNGKHKNRNYHPYDRYYYRQTIIPIGLKASYYFDELLAQMKAGIFMQLFLWDLQSEQPGGKMIFMAIMQPEVVGYMPTFISAQNTILTNNLAFLPIYL